MTTPKLAPAQRAAKKPKKLSAAQVAMLQRAKDQGFVLAPAGVPTAWILERAGLLRRMRRWVNTQMRGAGYIRETYVYELHLTDAGRAAVEASEHG